jgi:16S rRNA (cytosine967-C5)-methyltransferase
MNKSKVLQAPLRQLLVRAAQVIEAVIDDGQNLNRVLAQQPEFGRAAVQDMSYRCLREYGSLCALRDTLIDRPLRDRQIAFLILVALQQLRLRPQQAHVTVNEATEAAAKLHLWARGLTNAILRTALRRYASEGVWIDHPAQDTAAGSMTDAQALVAQWNYPFWWIEAVRHAYPEQWQAILIAGNQHPPFVLRVNTRKIAVTDYLSQLARAGIDAHSIGDEAVKLAHPVGVQQLPGFTEGWVSVQDAGAQRAAHYLDVLPGQRVLDACCAPGGKTAHLLELFDIELTAVDHDPKRLVRVEENLSRLNLHAQCVAADAAQLATWWDGKYFDRILADVPCSASGVVRRHPDIKWLRREDDISGFVRQQAELLEALWECLVVGGKLLYVTCSIFPQENQLQIDSFLKHHDNACQLPLNERYLVPNKPAGQLLPCEEHDGFFYALLEKT